MATDGLLGAVAVFVASIFATFHLSRKEPRRAAIDGPARAPIEEGDIPPSPSRIPRRALLVEEDDGEEDDDDDDDDVDGDDDDGDDDDDDDYDSDDGSDSDNEDNDDSDAAAIAATARSIFADTLAEKFAAQVADIAMTITVMKQIIEYAAAQGARNVSFQRHYLSNLGIRSDHSRHQFSGCIRIILDEHKVGTENDYATCDDWHGNLTILVGNPQLSYSSFLLGEFDSHGKIVVTTFTGVNNGNWHSGTGLTSLRMTSLKEKISKIDDSAQKELLQIEATLLSTQLLPLQQSISNQDVNRMSRHFQNAYCWKKILYSLRKDGFNANVYEHRPPPADSRYTSSHQSICSIFTVDLWNPLSKADRRAIHWSSYEDELKKHYGLCLPSKVSS